MEHPGWRRNRSVSSGSKNHGTKRNEAEQKTINVHLNRLPSYSELLRRIGPAAAQELTDCEGLNVPVSLLPGFSKAHNAGDDVYHQQAIDREFQREMRLAEEALRRREELGVRRWLQLQRQQHKMLERGNIADGPDYCRSPKHKRPFEPGQGRYASNTGVATYPNSTSRSAYCPEIAVKTKTSHTGRRERKELDEDFMEGS